MSLINIIRLNAKKNDIAIAYSTKDRIDLSVVTAPRVLASNNVDVYWFDGSLTDEGKNLPNAVMNGKEGACEIHQNVDGGPDRAIVYALDYLKSFQYKIVILIENDIYLENGWLEQMLDSISNAENDGFRVGASSARVFSRRVLSVNDNYCLLLNAGAACIALTQDALNIILDNYRTTTAEELRQHFLYLTNNDFSNTWELSSNNTVNQFLSADWFFDIVLYLNGFVVTSPLVTFARNIDADHEKAVATKIVNNISDHDIRLNQLITTPQQLNLPNSNDFKLQNSPISGRPLVPCHYLNLIINESATDNLIFFKGNWLRKWVQVLGPFEVFGDGSIVVKLHSYDCNILFHTRNEEAEINIYNHKNGATELMELSPNNFFEINVGKFAELGKSVEIKIISGSLGFVGVTLPYSNISYYLNKNLNRNLLLNY